MFGANDDARAPREPAGDAPVSFGAEAASGLERKAQRLHAQVKHRDRVFRRSVMADGAMALMLSLFLAEQRAVPMTEQTLALINLLEGDEGNRVVQSLVHAGLATVTGENPGRRTVGLSALGSARMRSFISDYPDI